MQPLGFLHHSSQNTFKLYLTSTPKTKTKVWRITSVILTPHLKHCEELYLQIPSTIEILPSDRAITVHRENLESKVYHAHQSWTRPVTLNWLRLAAAAPTNRGPPMTGVSYRYRAPERLKPGLSPPGVRRSTNWAMGRTKYLTLARFPYFATLASGGGGGGGWYDPPPWRSAPDGRRASRKKPVDVSRWDLSIAHVVFSPRSIFDLVRSGQRSNFREKWHFLDLHANSGDSMCRIDLKHSPACSPFNSEQDRVFLLYPITTCSIRSAPK